MRKKRVGAILIKSFALLAALATARLSMSQQATTQQAMPQDAATPYPKMAAVEEYLMDRNQEIALARSAAPEAISHDATVLVLGRHGYETAVEGKNGWVCWVGRGWGLFSIGPNFGTRRFEPRIASIHRPRAPCCRLLISGRNYCWPAIPRSRSSPR